MKPFFASLLAPLWLLPCVVFAGEAQSPGVAPQTLASVHEATEPTVAPSPAGRFRELFLEASTNQRETKPFRQSSEERQRMRNQMRDQAAMNPRKK